MTLYMRDRENLEKGREEMICELYLEGDISAEKAAERLNMSLEDFKKLAKSELTKA